MTPASLLPTVWIMRTRDGWYPIQPSTLCKPEDHGRLNEHVISIEDRAGGRRSSWGRRVHSPSPASQFRIANSSRQTARGLETMAYGEGGMTLRDYFAAAALPAVMNRMHEDIQHLGSQTFPDNVSTHAYRIADAMLAAREAGDGE